MRTKYGCYKEYHTSLDNFDLVNARGLSGGYKVSKKAILNLLNFKKEMNEKKELKSTSNPYIKFLCEPNLGKRGLFNLLGVRNLNLNTHSRKLLDFMQFSDGTNNLNQISRYIKLPFQKTKTIYKFLKKKKLLSQ